MRRKIVARWLTVGVIALGNPTAFAQGTAKRSSSSARASAASNTEKQQAAPSSDAARVSTERSTLPDPDIRLSEVLQGEAKEAYDQANALLDKNEFSGAFTLYRRAYEVSADPRLFWNMGHVEYLRKRNAEARTWVERYFAERKVAYNDVGQEGEASVREILRKATGEIVLTGVPAGTKVFLDGREVATAPLSRPLYVEPGVRGLRLVLPNRAFVAREEALTPGGQWTLDAGPLLRLPEVVRRAGATLSIQTGEAASSIQIDQRVVGRGKWNGVLPAGEHSVEVLLPGKQAFHERLTLTHGGVRTLSVKLKDEETTMVWPWVVGGVAAAAGLAVGGYFLLNRSPNEPTQSHPGGSFGMGGRN